MDRAIGKLVGIGGSAASSTSGQLPTSAEIEEVRELSCGAHWTRSSMLRKTQHVKRLLRWVASLYARDPIPPPRGHRLALDSVSLSF